MPSKYRLRHTGLCAGIHVVFLAWACIAAASTPEERSDAWHLFNAARENIVGQCVYHPKPEEVVWGALTGLAKELGPEYAKYFPAKTSGSLDDALLAYEQSVSALEEPLKKSIRALISRSLRAYCRTIDPYCDYDDYSTWSKIQDARKFSNVGIAVTLVDCRGEGFKLHPFPDGPADIAGIQDGDLLLEIDGVSMRGASKAEVVAATAGKEGTRVTFKVKHPNNTEEAVGIVRARFKGSPIKVDQTATGLRVTCREITEAAVADFRALLGTRRPGEELTLDLRGCGSGTVPAAVDMASLFLPENTPVATLETPEGKQELKSANKVPYRPSKLTILQDHFTASAAEMVIAALVGNRALRVETRGEKTYGKGVTQIQVEVSPDEKAMKPGGVLLITYTRIYGPNKEVWDGEGLPPTVSK